ncbi:MAG: PIG-L deacetylase family protein [Acidimicrobiia bacterium]
MPTSSPSSSADSRPSGPAGRAAALAGTAVRTGLRVATAAGGKGARLAVRTGRRPVTARWRRRVLAGGVDDTVASAGRRALVVAPHPDDETIGCGATIARKRAAGTAVDVAIVCDGRHSHTSTVLTPQQLADLRRAESIEACALLGVDEANVHVLGFEELTLWRALDDVADALAALIAEVDPEEILVISDQDWHSDHQATHVATLRAVQRSGFAGRVAAFPVWFWADGPWRTVPVAALGRTWRELVVGPFAARRLPTAELVRTDEYGERKRRAFTCYRTQTTNPTGEAGWATFEPDWIEPYLEAEVFFPVDAGAVARARLDRRQQVLGEVTPVAVGLPPASPRPAGPAAPPTGPRLAGLTVGRTDLLTGMVDGLAWLPAPGLQDGLTGALLRPDVPVGMATAQFETSARYAPDGRCGLLFRQDGAGGGWRLTVGPDHTELARRAGDGEPWTVVATERDGATAVEVVTVSVYDDGRRLDCRRDGATLFGGPVTDDAHADHHAAGPLSGPSSAVWLRRFSLFARA